MNTIIVILLIVLILWFFSRKKKPIVSILKNVDSKTSFFRSAENNKKAEKTEDLEPKEDEFGEYIHYYRLKKEIHVQKRYTHIRGHFRGKYYGEKIHLSKNHNDREHFYQIEIYEGKITNAIPLGNQMPLYAEIKPKNKNIVYLPNDYILQLTGETEEYQTPLVHPHFYNIHFPSKYHQIDDKEDFGIIEANIEGYIVDSISKSYSIKDYIPRAIDDKRYVVSNGTTRIYGVNGREHLEELSSIVSYTNENSTKVYEEKSANPLISTGITRNPETTPTQNNLPKTDRSYGKGSNITIWDILSWILIAVCAIIAIPFIIAGGIQLAAGLILMPVYFLIYLIPVGIYFLFKYLYKYIAALLLILACLYILYGVSYSVKNLYESNTDTLDLSWFKPTLPAPTIPNITDSFSYVNPTIFYEDSVITRNVSWQNYTGQLYEGIVYTRLVDLQQSTSFKNGLSVNSYPVNQQYDYMLSRLGENAKYKIKGVTQLFDSIQVTQHLTRKEFAEVIVSYIQQIPYAAILPFECDANLYNDNFLDQYLNSSDALCIDNQKFGILTPSETISVQVADCDSKVLLGYVLLKHYGFDVAILTSEFYKHSMLGINLPYKGVHLSYKNKKYYVWETTQVGLTPGVMPKSTANTNQWRFSLISKND